MNTCSLSQVTPDTRTMSILYTNDRGTFFTESFLENVKKGRNLSQRDIGTYQKLSDSAGMTLLHYAASYGKSVLVKNLVSAGADVNVQNCEQQTPLMFAVENEHEKTIKMLLKFNADMFMPDASGQCALAKAFSKDINRGYLDFSNTIKALLDKVTVDALRSSKYVDSQTFHRHCPLYRFIELLDDTKIVKILLEKGSPVDAKCPRTGDTALHWAVIEQSFETVKLLVEYKADVNAINDDGCTPLTIFPMYSGPRDEIFKFLIDAGAVLIDRVSGKSIVKDILKTGTKGMIRYILQSGIDLKLRDEFGETALHHLASNKEPHIFEELRGYDFNVNLRCFCCQRTMLHNAVSKANLSSVKFSLDHGADVNVRDYDNETPLCTLAFNPSYRRYNGFYSDNYLNCIELLLERGADPHIFTEDHSDSYIQHHYNNASDKMLLPIFAKLALYEASGRRIETFMREYIQARVRLQKLFDYVKSQLEPMKQIPISQHSSLTLYDFITANHRISRFALNKHLVSDLTEAIEAYNENTYYKRKLQQLLSNLNELLEGRQVTLDAVIDVFHKKTNLSVDIVAEKVVDHVLEEKWRDMFWFTENATVPKIVRRPPSHIDSIQPPKTKRLKLSYD